MTTAALLVTALLFGGMILYSFGFAAFIFSALPADLAGRRFAPRLSPLLPLRDDHGRARCHHGLVARHNGGLVACSHRGEHWPTRQVLMPAINASTDSGAKTRFKVLHGLSVAITLAHIGITGVVLARFG